MIRQFPLGSRLRLRLGTHSILSIILVTFKYVRNFNYFNSGMKNLEKMPAEKLHSPFLQDSFPETFSEMTIEFGWDKFFSRIIPRSSVVFLSALSSIPCCLCRGTKLSYVSVSTFSCALTAPPSNKFLSSSVSSASSFSRLPLFNQFHCNLNKNSN